MLTQCIPVTVRRYVRVSIIGLSIQGAMGITNALSHAPVSLDLLRLRNPDVLHVLRSVGYRRSRQRKTASRSRRGQHISVIDCVAGHRCAHSGDVAAVIEGGARLSAEVAPVSSRPATRRMTGRARIARRQVRGT